MSEAIRELPETAVPHGEAVTRTRDAEPAEQVEVSVYRKPLAARSRGAAARAGRRQTREQLRTRRVVEHAADISAVGAFAARHGLRVPAGGGLAALLTSTVRPGTALAATAWWDGTAHLRVFGQNRQWDLSEFGWVGGRPVAPGPFVVPGAAPGSGIAVVSWADGVASTCAPITRTRRTQSASSATTRAPG